MKKLRSTHPAWSHDGPPSLPLPGCEHVDTEREAAAGIAQAEELTAELRRPLQDVSKSAGEMERHSPLFFGTGDNPQLF